jgi:hypothetical protein
LGFRKPQSNWVAQNAKVSYISIKGGHWLQQIFFLKT